MLYVRSSGTQLLLTIQGILQSGAYLPLREKEHQTSIPILYRITLLKRALDFNLLVLTSFEALPCGYYGFSRAYLLLQ